MAMDQVDAQMVEKFEVKRARKSESRPPGDREANGFPKQKSKRKRAKKQDNNIGDNRNMSRETKIEFWMYPFPPSSMLGDCDMRQHVGTSMPTLKRGERGQPVR